MSPTPIDPVRKPDPTILNPQPPKKVEYGTTVFALLREIEFRNEGGGCRGIWIGEAGNFA